MRAVNRLLSALLGLALLGAGVVAAVEAVVIGLGNRGRWLPLDSWYDWLTTHRLDNSTLGVVLLCLGIAGLLLLIAELWPRRAVRLPIRLDGPGDAAWWLLRRPAEHRLAHDLSERLDTTARVRFRGRAGQRVGATVWAEQDRRDEVERAVRTRLNDLGLGDGAGMRVRLRAPKTPERPRVS